MVPILKNHDVAGPILAPSCSRFQNDMGNRLSESVGAHAVILNQNLILSAVLIKQKNHCQMFLEDVKDLYF